MPGTHYENEHSFIEELHFNLKRVAYRMIRSNSLEVLLLDLRSKHSLLFNEFSFEDGISDEEKERVIYACIVAKITSFDKELYISVIEETFLKEVLYKAILFLLSDKLSAQSSDDEILGYLKQYYPKTHYWINKSDEDDRYTLAIRSRRENTRRYFRYTAQISYHFIRLGSHEKIKELQGDIYTSGVKHFSKIVNSKLDILMANYNKNIKDALSESYPEAYTLFMVVAEKLDYLREVLNGISMGKIQIEDAKRFLQANIDNILDYQSLQGSIRTESILRDFEEKVHQINSHTLVLLNESSPHKLYEGPVLEKVKIDTDIRDFVEKKKRNQSSLLMSFIDLYHYSALLEKIYNNISSSNYIIIFPEYWSKEYHDISAGGFSFFSEFMVDQNDILELFFQIDISDRKEVNEYEIIHQKAKVVRVEENEDLGVYQISCMFSSPDENNINLIKKAAQSKEIRDAYDSSGLMDEF